MYKSNKTHRTFDNPKSFVNHLRSIYPNMQMAYMEENDIKDIPICPICNTRPLAFKSIFQGFKSSCLHVECKKQIRIKTNREIAKKKELGIAGFDEYINKHRTEVFNCIHYKIPFTDDFTGRTHINGYFLTQYSETKLKGIIFLESRICAICGKQFNINFLKTTTTCCEKCKKQFASSIGNKNKNYKASKFAAYCISLSNAEFAQQVKCGIIKDLLLDLRKADPYKAILLKTLRKSKMIAFCKELNHLCSFRIQKTTGNLYNETALRLYENGLLSNEIIELFYPTKILCSVCNSKIETPIRFKVDSKTLSIIEELPNTKYPYCSQKCYFDALSNKSQLYEYTEECKLKQSKTVKESILTGKFTPKSNNRKTHFFHIGERCYRSSWEFIFDFYFKTFKDIKLEYESIRIPYIINGIKRIYITDFFDNTEKIIYEIKPKAMIQDDLQKINAGIEYAKNNEMEFKIITEDFFRSLDANIKSYILEYVKDTGNCNLAKRCEKILCLPLK